jgi:flagellar hook-associated protein 3 FlgL
MKTAFISTLTLNTTPRANLQRLQNELAQASKEVVTGRMADVGLEIGHRTARSVTVRHDHSAMQALIDSNASVKAQLGQSQSTLSALARDADEFMQVLLTAGEAVGGAALLQSQAKSALDAFMSIANASDGGRYLFAGINTMAPPLADYVGAPKTAVDAAFAARFGLGLPNPQDDPLVPAIAAADMADFLDNEFAALFDDPAWTTDWSTASDTNLSAKISTSERVEISANANEAAMRKLAMAYTMAAELGTANLGAETLQVVIGKATEIVGSAVVDLTAIQARLGIAEDRVDRATARMQEEQDVLEARLAALEGVDPYEAKIRIDTLSTQIEMSYSLTNKLMQLSILNYA